MAAGADPKNPLPLSLAIPVHAGRGGDDPAAKVDEASREARRSVRDGPIPETIDRIVSAAQALLLNSGGRRVSAKDVSRKAGVSRGTLYRYFASIDEILEVLSIRLRDETDQELRRVVGGIDDPTERFEAFLAYMMHNRESERAARLMEVEPLFVLEYLRSNFDHFIARVGDVMSPVFDAWESRLGSPLDREALSETMVRYVLSELMVPMRPGAAPLLLRMRPMIEALLGSDRSAPDNA